MKKGMEIAYNCRQYEEMLSISHSTRQIIHEGSSRPPTLAALLKICAEQNDLHAGTKLHAEIAQKGLLEKDVFAGSALVSMYARCGSLAKAQDVFDKLPIRNVVSWNALISGYVQYGHNERGIDCFHQMQLKGISPDAVTFICILKACGSIGAATKGQEIYAEIVKRGLLDTNSFVGNALVYMYASCGLLVKAQEAFDNLVVRDIVSWNALIAGYVRHEHGKEALDCFHQMQLQGLSPNEVTLVCILKACGSIGALDKGQEIHTQIVRKKLLEKDTFVGNAVVGMYAKGGLLAKAQEVFGNLAVRDVVSWNALMTGYSQHGHYQKALNLFERMQLEGPYADKVTFVCMLKVCGIVGAVDKGHDIHAIIDREGFLENDPCVSNALVDMYCKFGMLDKAQEVFDKLLVRDVVSWSTLIAGYAQCGPGEEALKCYENMHFEGLFPDAVTSVSTLKACGSVGAIDKGREIHLEIAWEQLSDKDIFVGNALVDMYAKCGLVAKAREVFDKLPARDVISWNTIIAGYVQHRHCEEALNCFEQMQLVDLSPDAFTFACILKACGSIRATNKGQELHIMADREGLLENDIIVGNALVEMYSKCSLLTKAQEVFDNLKVRDVVSWNVLIAGYVQFGYSKEALKYFERMRIESLFPTVATIVCILKACGSVGAAKKGQQLHAEIMREGSHEKDSAVCNALVDMYAKCGLLVKAQEVFDNLPLHNVVSWNSLIAGYAQHEHSDEALICFERMQLEGLPPNAITFSCILKVCGSIGAIDKGQRIHAEIARRGLVEKDKFLGNTLVDMYSKCGQLAKAQEVFDNLSVCDGVSWNALITGYAQFGHGKEALNCFRRMQLEGLYPDPVTFVCVLKACGSIGAAAEGQEVHAEVLRKGLLGKDMIVGNALVDMYAKCGFLSKAHEVLNNLLVRDAVSWNALIAGYAQCGPIDEAVKCFEQMQLEGIRPDAVTFVCILKACGSMGAIDKGQEIHAEIVRDGWLKKDTFLGNAVVDMFVKCGLLAKAEEVFDNLTVRYLVTWNVLITGYGSLGRAEDVFQSFDKMLEEGLKPDVVTFTGVLNVCNHTGLVDKGQMYFETMSKGYGIMPTLEHYTCLVDLFGRSGHLDKAVAVIQEMPFSANLLLWHTMLGACRKWGDMKLGRLAFEHAMQLDEKDASAYVCMRNIYSDAGRQEDADRVEALRVKKQAWEKLGQQL